MAKEAKPGGKSGSSGILGVIAPAMLSLSIGGAIAWAGAHDWIPMLKCPAPPAAEVKTKIAASHRWSVRPVPPIITNLGGDSKTWIRLELHLLIEAKAAIDDTTAALFSQDVMAYLRTMKPAELNAVNGWRILMDDIDEIARVRGKGEIKNVLISSMVIE